MKSDRLRIATAIISCHLTLIGTLFFCLITDSLVIDEFTPLLTLLAPVTAIYTGSVFRYFSNKIINNSDQDKELLYANAIRRLIFGHFSIMFFLIISKTVFNWIEFQTLTILMTLLETSFGGYMGAVVNAVFGDQ